MPRILLVDDDEPLRRAVRRMLESAGHEVEEACDGRMALQVYEQRPCDVVLTDILMPGTDGLEMILSMRHLNPQVRIIAMSGGGMENAAFYLTSATEFGALLVIHKPFSKGALLDAVVQATAAAEANGPDPER
jgi:CheY-like chemotaxis protein